MQVKHFSAGKASSVSSRAGVLERLAVLSECCLRITSAQGSTGLGGLDYILLFRRLQRASDTICETSGGLITSARSAVKAAHEVLSFNSSVSTLLTCCLFFRSLKTSKSVAMDLLLI